MSPRMSTGVRNEEKSQGLTFSMNDIARAEYWQGKVTRQHRNNNTNKRKLVALAGLAHWIESQPAD